MPERINRCRISGSSHLVSVLDLGEQALTGVFPASQDAQVPREPLELVYCPDSHLLQLAHRFDPARLYGDHYGYRSGLNRSMVDHLSGITRRLARLVGLGAGDTVLDIGANDGTLLKSYTIGGLRRIGIDPTIAKFRSFYPPDISAVPDFFSAAAYRKVAGEARAKIVTSIAMFYDLEDPIAFARQVHDILDRNGVWHFEQSYMPSMLRMNSYDTVCHEHVSYYSLLSVLYILERAGLRAIDVIFNSINGGSFAVTAVRGDSPRPSDRAMIDWLTAEERRIGMDTLRPFREFEHRVFEHRQTLRSLIRTINADGKTVLGYGASTKGNVLLQFCGLSESDIPAIADVNPDKFGCFTPGTGIPIVSEPDARARKPDYFLVLPWHFKPGIIERERAFLEGGGRMIFPMPEVEIV